MATDRAESQRSKPRSPVFVPPWPSLQRLLICRTEPDFLNSLFSSITSSHCQGDRKCIGGRTMQSARRATPLRFAEKKAGRWAALFADDCLEVARPIGAFHDCGPVISVIVGPVCHKFTGVIHPVECLRTISRGISIGGQPSSDSCHAVYRRRRHGKTIIAARR